MQTKPLSYLSAFCGVLLLAGSPAKAQDCTAPPRNAQNVAVEVVDDTPSFINRFCTGPGSRNGDLCNAAGSRPEMVFRLQGGGAANWEMKSLMLDHAFQYMDAVWFHIGTDNIRSQKATAKLGVDHVTTETRTLSSGTALYECYRLSKATWQARQASGSG